MTVSLAPSPAFDQRIATREARVGIVGLGYAGLTGGLLLPDISY